MSKLNVLITGAGGRIGKHLLPEFQAAYALRTFDLKAVPGDPNAIVANLQDVEALKRAMAGIDVVLHLAATSDEAPFLEQLVPNNVVGLYNVLEAAVACGVRRVIFASTVQAIAWHGTPDPVSANAAPRPCTLYGATKAFGEAAGCYYHGRHKLEFLAVRIGWFLDYPEIGKQKLDNFGPKIWLSPKDACRLFKLAIEKPGLRFAVVNATSRTPKEILSLAEAKAVLGYEPEDSFEALFGQKKP